jgi:hypothetical protein
MNAILFANTCALQELRVIMSATIESILTAYPVITVSYLILLRLTMTNHLYSRLGNTESLKCHIMTKYDII